MYNSRRTFFSQIFAGIVAFADYTFFPFFNNKKKLTDIYCKLTKGPVFPSSKFCEEFGKPVAYWRFDGEGNIIFIDDFNQKNITFVKNCGNGWYSINNELTT